LLAACDHHQLVELTYQAAVDPALWPEVLAGCAEATGSGPAALLWEDHGAGEREAVLSRLDRRNWDLYRSRYATRNPLRPLAGSRAPRRAFRPRVRVDEDYLPKSDLVKTDFYNDFMRRCDSHSILTASLAVEGNAVASLQMGRPITRGAFETEDLAAAARLQPHLIRAFTLGRAVGAGAVGQDFAALMECSSNALIVTDAQGRPRAANARADGLMARADALTTLNGRLAAVMPADTRRLQGLIHGAAGADREERSAGAMTLETPRRRLPLSIMASPLRSERHAIFGGALALVCVLDPEDEVPLPEQTLRQLFDLTRAEVRVALALASGMDSREAADHLCLSFYTVRGHLARIFDKTRTRGQVELARLMTRAACAGLG
jgi:DNA-binding CsgD family transcriptional regulator/PAS domain-containing protein